MIMTDLDARAERVRAIAESNHGRVVDRVGYVMTVEIPADISIALNAVWGEGGFSCLFIGQRTRLSHRRVIDAYGHTIVRHQMVTTAFHRYSVDLAIDTRAQAGVPRDPLRADGFTMSRDIARQPLGNSSLRLV